MRYQVCFARSSLFEIRSPFFLSSISAGVFWSAEGAIAISYPMRRNRAFYIAWWLSFRVSGQILGGAINLGLNAHNDARGAVSYHVYQVFIALRTSSTASSGPIQH